MTIMYIMYKSVSTYLSYVVRVMFYCLCVAKTILVL